VLLKDGGFLCFDDIILKIRELLTPERNMISEIITICKLILVNPATSAAGERSFSTARRLKTWLWSSMTQEHFSNLTILNSHKDRTDRLSLLDIANEFKERNGNWKRNFGKVHVDSSHGCESYESPSICLVLQDVYKFKLVTSCNCMY